MQNPKRPRGYEDRLLSELKTYVSERNQTMTTIEETPAKTPRFGRAAKFSFAGAVGAVALGVGAVVALPALTASPAYAVEDTKGGNVRVQVNSPDDAAGLEEALAEHGIKAKVDFPPIGYVCDWERYEPAVVDDNGEGEAIELGETDEGEPFAAFEVNPDNYSLDGDITLVVEISEGAFDKDAENVMVTGLEAAKGEVGECDPVKDDE
ncbi:hypothetical protein Snas_4595 [Stackebrandtia nassauensis DSM 44728]|uniref:Uncharacterized protein n=2 Tax=Stackebrandtia TaxID=283810 RepID=D3Q6J6_STANL|nr:hypothetical protein Snas_4595 [Stackebrandtia nassauensis DSM 44728]